MSLMVEHMTFFEKYLPNTSNSIVKNHDMVIIEDLNPKVMTKLGVLQY